MTIKCPICGKVLEIKTEWIEEFKYDFLGLLPGYELYKVKCNNCGYFESMESAEGLKERVQAISRQPECNPEMKLVSEYLERTLGRRPEVSDIIKMLGNLKAPKSL